jgi:hypothetical protein
MRSLSSRVPLAWPLVEFGELLGYACELEQDGGEAFGVAGHGQLQG